MRASHSHGWYRLWHRPAAVVGDSSSRQAVVVEEVGLYGRRDVQGPGGLLSLSDSWQLAPDCGVT